MHSDVQPTPASLLIRVRDPGDAVAWSEFQRRYAGLISGYCRACGLQPADADDVRQVVMLDLSKALPKFRYEPARGLFRHYLRRVVRRAIIRHKTRHTRNAAALWTLEAMMSPDEATDHADECWEHEWMLHHYRLAMEGIRASTDQRTMGIFDRLLLGHSPAQIAVDLGMNEPAIRKIKQRLRDRLRERIASQITEEDPDG